MDVPLLIFSNTRVDSDLRYLIGAHVPDDIAIVFDGVQMTALASALEINRLRNESKISSFIGLDSVKASMKSDKITSCDLLSRFLNDLGLKKICVKRNFPIYLADKLRASGFEIVVLEFSILPQRLVKSDAEIMEIRSAIGIVAKIFAQVEKILADSSVNGKNELVYGGEILTSERLRSIMDSECYRLGALAEDTIVSCGLDACDPHCVGHGPLRAGEFILIDFFPHLRSSGYYADVSRTFVKGKPSGNQIGLYETVKLAHDMAIETICDGCSLDNTMEKVFAHFEANGYNSSKISNPPRGMFHSLGHGLGLDIHEPPRLDFGDDILKAGMVVTVEPGLYYREIGGVRIEDDILVREKSCEILGTIPYNWTID
ncbi:MAG: Xaa-Pro peptidase family protein [Puniceicoccales bacterium]|jgi:Xaa-Pro aminopeptidase|nr:Xaa-Pro peptidase family protein [Puniceicoccales bacterium]